MVDDTLTDRKIEDSVIFVQTLAERGAPILAAFWDFPEERGRWVLVLVPRSNADQAAVVHAAADMLVEPPYRYVFSLSDPIVDSHQIERAKALAVYLDGEVGPGQRILTTFTGGHYFEAAIPLYFACELAQQNSVPTN